MAEPQIRYDDAAGYERYMGHWSQLAGDAFLQWLAPPNGLRWLDIGCGNGAFTELIVERCAPAAVQGIDPSEAQIAYARTRLGGRVAEFRQGDAMALPFADASFEVAVMALVIFFVPDPAKSIAEMIRVAGPGGTVATYVWDILNGGFPLDPIQAEMRAMGLNPVLPPRSDVTPIDVLRDLWASSALDGVDARPITVQRTFADFEDFWSTTLLGASIRPMVAAMAPDDVERLKARLRARMTADAAGRITYPARANAVKGRVPK